MGVNGDDVTTFRGTPVIWVPLLEEEVAAPDGDMVIVPKTPAEIKALASQLVNGPKKGKGDGHQG